METQKNLMLEALFNQLIQQRLIDRRKYSLRSVAQRINVSHSMLSQILKGKKKPSPLLLRRLCEDLGMNESQKLQILNDLLCLGAKAKKYLSPTDYQGYSHQDPRSEIRNQKSFQVADLKDTEKLNGLIKNYVEELIRESEGKDLSENLHIVLGIKTNSL